MNTRYDNIQMIFEISNHKTLIKTRETRFLKCLVNEIDNLIQDIDNDSERISQNFEAIFLNYDYNILELNNLAQYRSYLKRLNEPHIKKALIHVLSNASRNINKNIFQKELVTLI